MAAPAEIDAHALSHVGKVREDNQDALSYYEPKTPDDQYGYLYAVADGMGGYSHGGIASALALETFIGTVHAQQSPDMALAFRKGVQDANIRVYQEARRLNVGRMGTTLTAIGFTNTLMQIAHIGDSRAYLLRNGTATCLTNDHTRVGEMVRMRVLTPDKVRTHSQRSVLNKCLGIELFVQPDITQTRISSGDTLLLCSDGLWSVLEDNEIAEIVRSETAPEAINERLIDVALHREESDDNISALTICIRHIPDAVPAEKKRNWFLPPLLRGRTNIL